MPLFEVSMIHPTALIDPQAQLHPSVQLGPYVIIEGPVQLEEGVKVEAHAQILGRTKVGSGTRIGRAAILGGEPQDLSFDPKTESFLEIGERNDIREHVTIHRGSKSGYTTRVGNDNFLMGAVHLAHDVVLGNKNVIANAALLAGHVQVGHHSFIGGGSVFHQFIRIGDYCVIQGNCRFSQDIPHYCSAHGYNLIAGMNVIGLRRAGFTTVERNSVKAAFELIYRDGLNLSQALSKATAISWPEKAEYFIQFFKEPSKKGICRLAKGEA
jgi:UDP-N-acetylglucosamine acyltransferase